MIAGFVGHVQQIPLQIATKDKQPVAAATLGDVVLIARRAVHRVGAGLWRRGVDQQVKMLTSVFGKPMSL